MQFRVAAEDLHPNRKRGRDHAVGLADELFALWSALRSERELAEARD
jgi:hypothetical protein